MLVQCTARSTRAPPRAASIFPSRKFFSIQEVSRRALLHVRQVNDRYDRVPLLASPLRSGKAKGPPVVFMWYPMLRPSKPKHPVKRFDAHARHSLGGADLFDETTLAHQEGRRRQDPVRRKANSLENLHSYDSARLCYRPAKVVYVQLLSAGPRRYQKSATDEIRMHFASV